MQYNILNFGAVADCVTNNQPMIQAAIDACAQTGGTVVVPAGRYRSGTIRLRSNVNLHLEAGSVLEVSHDPAHIILFSDNEEKKKTMDGVENGCFLYACHEKNITISGEGMIDGCGRNVYFDDDADGDFHECPLNVRGFRPRTTYLEDVDGLTVRGITFYDACFWTLHMAGCRNVIVDGIRILSNDRGPNNDGIDPDGCKNVTISNCLIESGDDSSVLKVTRPTWEKYGDCETVTITNCVLHSRDSALKIGTETHGNIRNVVFGDCVVKDCSRAVGIWVRDGGIIEDIMVHHIIGNTRRYADCPARPFAPRWWGKGEPIFLSSTYRNKELRRPGIIRDVSFDHIRLTSESAIFLGGEADAVIRDVSITDSKIVWKQQSKHRPNVFDEQPSPGNVYEHRIPWLYARHVEGLTVSGKYTVDHSLAGYVEEEEILEACSQVEIRK